jgi:hypothetical protein
LNDYELIAQKLSKVAEQVDELERSVSDINGRIAEIENVNARLEEAALTTARALQEVSHHWDSVYEAMRRKAPAELADE